MTAERVNGPQTETVCPDDDDDGPHRIHLLPADPGLTQKDPACRVFMALCGATWAASTLPDLLCADDDCERVVAYCRGCLDVANEHNHEARVAVDCPPGIYVRTAR